MVFYNHTIITCEGNNFFYLRPCCGKRVEELGVDIFILKPIHLGSLSLVGVFLSNQIV